MSDTSANKPNSGPRGEPQGGFDEAGGDAQETVIPFTTQQGAETVADAEPLRVDPAVEWKNKATYLSAEIENMRKRFVREKQDVVRFANEELVRKLLPVFDNIELALKATKDAEIKLDPAIRDNPVIVNLIKGLDMTMKSFEQALEGIGCLPIKGMGENFDPNFHEALGQSSQADAPDNAVIGVMQRGFTLFGRVVRPARVLVNKVNTPSA